MPPLGEHTQWTWLDGQRISGGVVSRTTVTVKVHRSITLPAGSVASQVTGWLPTGNELPEGGSHLTVTFELQRLISVTSYSTGVLSAQLITSMSSGQRSTTQGRHLPRLSAAYRSAISSGLSARLKN